MLGYQKVAQLKLMELDSIYGNFCDAVESHLIVKDLSLSRKKHKLWWNPSLTELRKVARQSHSKCKSKNLSSAH